MSSKESSAEMTEFLFTERTRFCGELLHLIGRHGRQRSFGTSVRKEKIDFGFGYCPSAF